MSIVGRLSTLQSVHYSTVYPSSINIYAGMLSVMETVLALSKVSLPINMGAFGHSITPYETLNRWKSSLACTRSPKVFAFVKLP